MHPVSLDLGTGSGTVGLREGVELNPVEEALARLSRGLRAPGRIGKLSMGPGL